MLSTAGLVKSRPVIYLDASKLWNARYRDGRFRDVPFRTSPRSASAGSDLWYKFIEVVWWKVKKSAAFHLENSG
jgi:hypothetical protein